jgi:methyltransferase (TIGR00027 family)
MTDTLIQDVTDTAFMVATYRAMESERPDALFHDPLARKLAGERGEKIVASMSAGLRRWPTAMRPRIMVWMMAIRTRIIDDFITCAIARGADAILNLGAGLDTRPYRMDLPPSLAWIEVDYPRTIEFKDSRLGDETPRCQLERVKLDLADLPARARLFAELGSRFKNVLVLTEGVVPYLSNADAARLADDLRSQPTFTRWIVDYFSAEAVRLRKRAAIQRQMRNAPLLFEPTDFFGFFKQHGWSSVEIRFMSDEGKRLNRPIPIPLPAMALFAFASLFVSKARREARRKFAAYVMLEPT